MNTIFLIRKAKEMGRFVARHSLVFSVFVFFILFSFAVNVFATYPATPYGPGDTTLNPACAPGSSANCTVMMLPTQTGNTGEYLMTDGTTASWEPVASNTFSNGLTLASSVVKLGGTLTQDTTFDFNTRVVTWSGEGQFIISTNIPSGFSNPPNSTFDLTNSKILLSNSQSGVSTSSIDIRSDIIYVTGNTNFPNLTASRAVYTNSDKTLASSATTATELGYVSGVTSAIQTQLNNKESALTFSTGLTRSTNTITNNLSTGVSGGQSLYGDTGPGGTLNISSTSDSTKGQVNIGNIYFDEANHQLGIGTPTPGAYLDVFGATTQLRLAYASNKHTTFTTDSGGDIIITPNGSDTTITGNLSVSNLTASRALTTNSSNKLASSATTDTELGYVSGVTSAIQTQLNARVTNVTASLPLTSSGGTTPNLTIAIANTATDGVINSTDWNIFNNKVSSQWITTGSDIYYNTGNVGIGTTTPSSRLHVFTNAADSVITNEGNDNSKYIAYISLVGGQTRMVAGSNPSTGTNPYFTGTGDRANLGYASFFGSGESYATQIGSYNGVAMTLLANGNVGIGTIAPTNKLQILGGNIFIDHSMQLRGGVSDSVYGYIELYNGSTGALTIQPRGNNDLFLSPVGTGNVGIGVSTIGASTKLQVAGMGLFTGGTINPGDSTPAGVAVGYNVASDYGFITAIRTGVANKNLILQGDGGFVGIGSANTVPNSYLDVQGPTNISSFTGSSYLGLSVKGGTSTNYSGIDFTNYGTTPKARIASYSSGSGSYLQFGTSDNYSSGITNTAMTIDYRGNVGIGTATPYVNDVDTFAFDSDSHMLSIVANSVSRDAGLFLRSADYGEGLDMWVDGSNGKVYLDSRMNDYTKGFYFRSATAGTPVNVAALLPAGFSINTHDPLGAVPTGFDTSTGSVAIRVNVNPTTNTLNRDIGMLLRSYEDTEGVDLWYDGSADTTYFDSRNDLSTADIVFRTRTAGTPLAVLSIGGDGNVGIGTTTPSVPLEVLGTGTGATIAKFTDVNTTGCAIATGGTISCSSDIRFKKNIEDIGFGLDTVMALRPVVYNWKYEIDGTVKNPGFIAQEVEAIVPKLVSTDENGFKSLNTIALVPILTRSIQELDLKIQPLMLLDSGTTGTLGYLIKQFLADSANNIQNIFTNKITTKTICVDDDTCLNEDDIRALINAAHNNGTSGGTSGSSGSGDTSGTTTGSVSGGATDSTDSTTGTDSGSTTTNGSGGESDTTVVGGGGIGFVSGGSSDTTGTTTTGE